MLDILVLEQVFWVAINYSQFHIQAHGTSEHRGS